MNSERPNMNFRPRMTLASAPAVQALLIQSVSFMLVLALAHGLSLGTEVQLTVAVAAVVQAVLATAISRWRALASWWLLIQFAFPVALVAALSLQLPSWIFLAAFILLLGLYWSTFRTQVPFYPSNPAVWNAVANVLPRGRPLHFIDIGSGLGSLAMHLAKQRPESVFVGIEIAPLPWLASLLQRRIRRSNARFIRGDYGRLDFGCQDVVFAYLSPAAMPALWRKARAEMRPGSLLLSYEFPIDGVEPHFICVPAEGGPFLYGWHF
jgi:hypothetical protein